MAKTKFFAAANTYNGFVSFFDEVFRSEEYDSVYILKGGPGTGKSSLMKSISIFFDEKGCETEKIYCSSDPNSLDGVILSFNNKKIALLDGTAPHERDAVVVGVTDRIINLADGIDKKWISTKKDDIYSLIKEKKNAYITAYSYLKLAGASESHNENIYKGRIDVNGIKKEADYVLSDFSSEKNANVQSRLISSFNRYGEKMMDDIDLLSKRKISIQGHHISSAIFIHECLNILVNKNHRIIKLLNPLCPKRLDGLYVKDLDLLILRSPEGEINADDFVRKDLKADETARVANIIKGDALDEAKRWFSIASDIHFRLEEIYVQAMDFSKNDEKVIQITKEIENIFEIST